MSNADGSSRVFVQYDRTGKSSVGNSGHNIPCIVYRIGDQTTSPFWGRPTTAFDSRSPIATGHLVWYLKSLVPRLVKIISWIDSTLLENGRMGKSKKRPGAARTTKFSVQTAMGGAISAAIRHCTWQRRAHRLLAPAPPSASDTEAELPSAGLPRCSPDPEGGALSALLDRAGLAMSTTMSLSDALGEGEQLAMQRMARDHRRRESRRTRHRDSMSQTRRTVPSTSSSMAPRADAPRRSARGAEDADANRAKTAFRRDEP